MAAVALADQPFLLGTEKILRGRETEAQAVYTCGTSEAKVVVDDMHKIACRIHAH